MARGEAEDLAQRAASGATSRRLVVQVGREQLREARLCKGVVAADRRRVFGPRGGGANEQKEGAWRLGPPVTVTLSRDLAGASDAALERLLNLSRLDDVGVDVSEIFPRSTLPTKVGRLSVGHDGEIVTTTRVPDAWCLASHEPGFAAAVGEEVRTPGESVEDARQTVVDFVAHQTLRSDLFVTTYTFMLEHRFDRDWLVGAGVCSPEEGLAIVEGWLRSRRSFVVDVDDRVLGTFGFIPFYQRLACGLFRPVADAMRSALAPARRGHLRSVAGDLEAILLRCHDMLVAGDHLGRLAQEEGYLGGNNALASEQMYHLRNSFVLFTGCLDVLAWVVADLEASGVSLPKSTVRPTEVAWRKLRKGASWTGSLTSTEARSLLGAAEAVGGDDALLIELVYELRNAFQHGRPAQASVAAFRCASDDLTRAAFTVVELDTEVLARAPVPDGLDGCLSMHGATMLVPHRFQRAMVITLAQVLQGVLGAIAWPDTDWWRGEVAGLGHEIPEDHLLWIGGFGPPVDRPRVKEARPPDSELAAGGAPS